MRDRFGAQHPAPWHCPRQVCKNPRNPGFNHHLFESVAALIRHVGGSSPAMIDTFEQLLFPAFNHVLQQVGFFIHLFGGRGGGVPAGMPLVQSPVWWMRALCACIAAMVRNKAGGAPLCLFPAVKARLNHVHQSGGFTCSTSGRMTGGGLPGQGLQRQCARCPGVCLKG